MVRCAVGWHQLPSCRLSGHGHLRFVAPWKDSIICSVEPYMSLKHVAFGGRDAKLGCSTLAETLIEPWFGLETNNGAPPDSREQWKLIYHCTTTWRVREGGRSWEDVVMTLTRSSVATQRYPRRTRPDPLAPNQHAESLVALATEHRPRHSKFG
jgi:hypothetical protein